MNCMAASIEQVLAEEVGLPQESHHHHVEGIGTDSEQSAAHSQQGHHHGHSHGHGHGHGQTHDHSHHPYPHADHPLGPHSLPGKRENGKIICPCGRWAVAEAEIETETATGGAV